MVTSHGVDMVRCSCTGAVNVVPCGIAVDDEACPPDDDCHTLMHFDLSPSDIVCTYSFVAMPCMLALPQILSKSVSLISNKNADYYDVVICSPPRSYLSFIRILII